uniref:Methionine sulfoxide reductase B1 n=1 Tax=Cyanistes caeruleus TaxID=156563 RepID=A0A8C0VS14_CYACU
DSWCWFLEGEGSIYVCAKCGHELFSSRAKYEHSSPWPAFTETLRGDSVAKREERPGALKVTCGKCGNGLGHEFLNDGPKKGQSRTGRALAAGPARGADFGARCVLGAACSTDNAWGKSGWVCPAPDGAPGVSGLAEVLGESLWWH